MLTVHLSTSSAKSKLNRIRSNLASKTFRILNECGQRLVGLARIYFDNLSRGGTGFTGRSWPAPSAATVRKRQYLARRGLLRAPVEVQGIVTGELQRSLRYDISENAVRVSYDTDYSQIVNRKRRLIPTRLPNAWRAELDAIVKREINPGN